MPHGRALVYRRSRVLGPNGQPARVLVRGKYDAAQTNDQNRKHWANADALSADAANNSSVRYALRNRARYEFANSGYLHGIVQTLANDTIGIGPNVQFLTGDANADRFLEVEFRRWMRATGLAQKLRTMRKSRVVDGESFAMLVTNKRLATPVKLGLRLIEAEQVATPGMGSITDNAVDGIEFDELGEPLVYHVLKGHPGGSAILSLTEYDPVPAERMIHWFRQDRPGQHRGVPEITATLQLWGETRRYTDAVIAAAETAADFAMVLESTLPPDTTDDDTDSADVEGEAFDTIELEKRLATILPTGYKLGQTKAEQPTTGYKEFLRGRINEGARPLNMPYNIAACDSAEYNYASGRLDHQTYDLAIGVDREECDLVVLSPIISAWLAEAALLPEYLPASVVALVRFGMEVEHRCSWRGRKHVDPAKEATAAKTLLDAGLITKRDYHAANGDDWEELERQRYEERLLERTLSAKLPPDPNAPAPAGETADETPDETADETEEETADV